MATKKQRRRREKDRRHEYEFVYYDEEGNEVELEQPERPEKAAPKKAAPAKAGARNGRAARPGRAPKPPTWRSVGRLGIIMFALLFLFSALLIRAPLDRLVGASGTVAATQSTPAGVTRVFKAPAVAKGTVNTLAVYVDKSSKATGVVAGLYSDQANRPGKLLAQASGKPSAGKWNSLKVSSKGAPQLVKGKDYWIALLGTGGKLVIRQSGNSTIGVRESSGAAQTLPASWSGPAVTVASFPAVYVAKTGSVSIAQRLLLPLLYSLILIPSIYLMQRMTYRSYLKRTGQLPQQPQRPRRKS